MDGWSVNRRDVHVKPFIFHFILSYYSTGHSEVISCYYEVSTVHLIQFGSSCFTCAYVLINIHVVQISVKTSKFILCSI
jgi:hypothetical protein